LKKRGKERKLRCRSVTSNFFLQEKRKKKKERGEEKSAVREVIGNGNAEKASALPASYFLPRAVGGKGKKGKRGEKPNGENGIPGKTQDATHVPEEKRELEKYFLPFYHSALGGGGEKRRRRRTGSRRLCHRNSAGQGGGKRGKDRPRVNALKTLSPFDSTLGGGGRGRGEGGGGEGTNCG